MVLETSGTVSDSGFLVAHISDIHFGRIAHPAIVNALVDDVNAAKVDLVVISGDLTQRAFPHQYRAAAAMLAAFEAPWIAIPGNHDVFPWWRAFSRLSDPLRRYRKWITGDLSPSFQVPGLSVLGINSAFGGTIKGGRIDASQRAAMRAFYGNAPKGDFKILAVHHHLTALEALGDHDVAIDAEATLQCAADMEVDLILCGHLHVSHVAHVEVVPATHRIVIASAGTATSDRGRKPHRKSNFYNRIAVGRERFSVAEHIFDTHTLTFKEDRTTRFEIIR